MMRKRVLEIMDKGGFVIDLWLLKNPSHTLLDVLNM